MFKRILLPIDGSPTSNKALAAGLQLAREGGSRVRLVHALDDLLYLGKFAHVGGIEQVMRNEARKILEDARAVASSAGVQADITLLDSTGMRLGETVAAYARECEADLIVIGTHGRRGVGRALLGSGAEEIIRLAPVPVLVIRSDERALA